MQRLPLQDRQPVYSTTEKLRVKGITNRSFAKLTQVLFERIKQGDIVEVLPTHILRQYNLCNRYAALRWLHFPDTEEHEQMARHRMKWEELFISQLMIARLRLQHTAQQGWLFGKVGDNFNDFFQTASSVRAYRCPEAGAERNKAGHGDR